MAPFVFQIRVHVEVMLDTIVVNVVEPFTLLAGIFVKMVRTVTINVSVPLIKRKEFCFFMMGMSLVVGYTFTATLSE